MKDNLGQECETPDLSGKIGTIAPDFPEKVTVFPVLTLLFQLSLPKFPPANKLYF